MIGKVVSNLLQNNTKCTLERIRTSDLRFRKPLLYPTELPGHKIKQKFFQRKPLLPALPPGRYPTACPLEHFMQRRKLPGQNLTCKLTKLVNEKNIIFAFMKSIFKTSQRNEKDFGFGKIASEENRMRLINRDGSFNVERKGLNFFTSLSIYHFLLDITWTKFFSLAALGYILMNIFFASIYVLIGDSAISGHVSSSFWELFANSFFFSIQTSSTIGFGQLIP